MASRDDLIAVFEDTAKWYQQNEDLKEAVAASIRETSFFAAEEMPELGERRFKGTVVTVSRYRSLETAMFYQRKFPKARICVHNFASATNPGGGVKKGSRAQEEAICRCTTLYPSLNTEENWSRFYKFHRNRHDARYTDACLYTPNIVVIKSDADLPQRLPKEKWGRVDIITCAAPNLRVHQSNAMNPDAGRQVHISDQELRELHVRRARHMLAAANSQGVDIMILGAFGCGAFQNNPRVVAEAYKKVLAEFEGQFQEVHFAVYYSPRDLTNYETFKKMLG